MKLFSAVAGLAVLASLVFSPFVHAAGMDAMMPKQAEKATPGDLNYHGKKMDAAGKPMSNKSSVLGTTRSKSLSMTTGDCGVIGNSSSKIYHMAGSKVAAKMAHPVCFKTEAAAQSSGYRKAKNEK